VIFSGDGAWRNEKVPWPGLRPGRVGCLVRVPLEKGGGLTLALAGQALHFHQQFLVVSSQLGHLRLQRPDLALQLGHQG
jgi:hypothetical protein